MTNEPVPLDGEPVPLSARRFRKFRSYRNYRSEEIKEKKKNGIFNYLEEMEYRLENKMKPDGTRFFPAKSCKDLKLCHPDTETGYYWLDTNGGDVTDAFLAHCMFDDDRMETCIQPQKTKYEEISYTPVKKNRFTWFLEEIRSEDDTFKYDVSTSQLNHLRISSGMVRQNLTYHCLNSRAKIMVMTRDEQEMASLDVLSDECSRMDGEWRKSVFEVQTRDTDQLPIQDVAVMDIGEKNQRFKLQVGPICFE